MQYWDNDHMDDGWAIAMMLGMLGIWALIAVALVWALRSSRTWNTPPASPPPTVSEAPAPADLLENAQRILAERLARGEIEPEEYEKRLQLLIARDAL